MWEDEEVRSARRSERKTGKKNPKYELKAPKKQCRLGSNGEDWKGCFSLQ